jgi:DNA-binding response OmpR family regulator
MDGECAVVTTIQRQRCRAAAVYGDLVLDITSERALIGGYEVILQQSDWAILARLADSNGTFVRGTELLATIWGDDMRDDPMFLRTWIQRLNERLANCSGRRLIDTGPGVYRLLTPAEWSARRQRIAS